MCVCEGKKEACGHDPDESNHITAAKKWVSGPRTRAAVSRHEPRRTSPSTDTTSQLFTSLRVPNEQKPKRKAGEILDQTEGKGAAVAVPPAAPQSTHLLLRTRKKKTQQLDMEDQTVD